MKRKLTANFAELIERMLEDAGLTAYRLGQRSGVTAAQISLYRSGKREPTAATLQRLLAGAGLPWAWVDANLAAVDLPSDAE